MPRSVCKHLFALALILACWPLTARAQREVKDIPDPDPELERKALQLADGFEIDLVTTRRPEALSL